MNKNCNLQKLIPKDTDRNELAPFVEQNGFMNRNLKEKYGPKNIKSAASKCSECASSGTVCLGTHETWISLSIQGMREGQIKKTDEIYVNS